MAMSTTHRNVCTIWPCNLQCERRTKRADGVVQGINVVVKSVDAGKSNFQHPTLEQSLWTHSYKPNLQGWYFLCSLTFVQSFICTMTEATSHKRVFWFQGISFNVFIFLIPHILLLCSLQTTRTVEKQVFKTSRTGYIIVSIKTKYINNFSLLDTSPILETQLVLLFCFLIYIYIYIYIYEYEWVIIIIITIIIENRILDIDYCYVYFVPIFIVVVSLFVLLEK